MGSRSCACSRVARRVQRERTCRFERRCPVGCGWVGCQEISRLAKMRAERNLNYRIEVDGGVALDTVQKVVRAGAEILVAGNAVFGKGDPTANAQALIKAAFEATLQRV